VRETDTIICADAGAERAIQLGLTPHVAIGDFDSITAETFETLKRLKVPLHQHPAHKDQTDLELALEWVSQKPKGQIVLVGAFGGRMDQSLGNIFSLLHPRLTGFQLSLYDGETFGHLLQGKDSKVIETDLDETVSLIPLSAEVHGVEATGLVWPLNKVTLERHSSLSISNRSNSKQVSISIDSGVLLLLRIVKDA
jgi:thiamine pyrophosphokinase